MTYLKDQVHYVLPEKDRNALMDAYPKVKHILGGIRDEMEREAKNSWLAKAPDAEAYRENVLGVYDFLSLLHDAHDQAIAMSGEKGKTPID